MKFIKHDVVLSFFLILLIFFISFEYISPDYLFADDFLFRQILDGTIAGNEGYYESVIAINIIYSRFIAVLYSLRPDVIWYDYVFLLITIIASFVSLCATLNLLKEFKKKLFCLFLFFFLLPVFFIKVQFSLVSGIVNFSIAMVLLNILTRRDLLKSYYILSFIYIFCAAFLSFLIRSKNFYFCALSFGAITVFFLYKKIIILRVLQLIPLLLAVLFSQFLAQIYNSNYYNSEPRVDGILEHNAINFFIMDGNVFPDKETIHKIDKFLESDPKWSVEDFVMLRSGFYFDKDIFCYECSRDLYDKVLSSGHLISKQIFSFDYLKLNVKSTFDLLAPILPVLILIGIFVGGPNGSITGLTIFCLVFVIILLCGFAFKQIPLRIGYPVMFFSCIITLLSSQSSLPFNDGKLDVPRVAYWLSKERILLLGFMIVFLSIPLSKHYIFNYKKRLLSEEIRYEFSVKLEKDKVYFHHTFPYPWDTYEVPYQEFFDGAEQVKLLSWLYLTPAYQDFFTENGLISFTKDICIHGGKFRLIFDEGFAKQLFPYWKRFLLKHHDLEVKFIRENEFSFFNLHKDRRDYMGIYKCEVQ